MKKNVFAKIVFLGSVAFCAGYCIAAEVEVSEKYRNAWEDPVLVKRIEQGIEKNRKGDAVIKVLDEKGNPLPGATISVKLQKHDFLFGCNAFVLGQLKTPEMNSLYEERFTKIFNFATVPFYWGDNEPEQGKTALCGGV